MIFGCKCQTQDDPLIIEDERDLDSLRHLSMTQWHWVELANDIDLGMFASWNPIPAGRFNIDGKGHKITNMRVFGSFASLGLFARLETLETKDLRIEAEIISTAANAHDIGILCGRLVGGHFNPSSADPHRTAIVSNVQCFGSITVTVTGATQPTGGCFGSAWGESNVTLLITDCAYYGSITCHITSSSSTAPSASQLRSFGGILGMADARGSVSNYTLSLSNCISVAQFVMPGSTAHAVVGGIIGAARVGSAPNVAGCVAKNKLLVTNLWPITQPIWFGGIVGSGIVACNISMCAAHSEVVYDPKETVAGLHVAGLHCMRSTGTSLVIASYAVVGFRNPDNAALPATRSMRGIGAQTAVTSSFFDSDVLAEGWPEAVTNPEWGRTTAQLQSRGFFEPQGWVFADV